MAPQWIEIRETGFLFDDKDDGYCLDILAVPATAQEWPPPWPWWWRHCVEGGTSEYREGQALENPQSVAVYSAPAGEGILSMFGGQPRVGDVVYQVRRAVVRHTSTPLWGLIRWSPAHGERISVHGLAELESWRKVDASADLDRMRRSIGLARDMLKRGGGRPPGTGFFPDGLALRALLDPVVLALKSKGQPTTQKRVLRMVEREVGDETNEAQLGRWTQQHLKLTWEQYVETVQPSD